MISAPIDTAAPAFGQPPQPKPAIATPTLVTAVAFPALLAASQDGLAGGLTGAVSRGITGDATGGVEGGETADLSESPVQSEESALGALPEFASGLGLSFSGGDAFSVHRGGTSQPQIGSLLPPGNFRQPASAASDRLTPQPLTARPAPRLNGDGQVIAADENVQQPGPQALRNGAVILDRDTTYLSKNSPAPQAPIKSDGPEVSRREKAIGGSVLGSISPLASEPVSASGTVPLSRSLSAPLSEPAAPGGPGVAEARSVRGGGRPGEVSAQPEVDSPQTITPAAPALRAQGAAETEAAEASLRDAVSHSLAATIAPRIGMPIANDAAASVPLRTAEPRLAEEALKTPAAGVLTLRNAAPPPEERPARIRDLPSRLLGSEKSDLSRFTLNASEPAPTPQSTGSAAQPLTSGAALAAPAAHTLANLANPIGAEPRGEIRAGQTLETIVNQLAEAREAGRSARPEMTLRHQDFGAVNMRIDATGNDWRVTLASRDHGFVPAVQAALNDRAFTSPSDSAPGQSARGNDRGHDQGSGQNSSSNGHASQGQFGHSGGSSEGRYGSLLGDGQGSSQPYLEQSEANESDGPTNGPSSGAGEGRNDPNDTGLFA